MAQAARWLVVVVVALACAATPAVLRALPAHSSDITAVGLAKRIHASAGLSWSGEVHSQGSLQVPLSGDSFGGVARLLGGQTNLRVWWRDPEHWRVDRIRTSGEEDLIRDGSLTAQWTYESSVVRFTPYSPIRLPDDSDMVPGNLAKRLLAGARPGELSRLPSRRVGGRSAAGLRLVPADSRTTVDRVEVWADDTTGLPLRVDVYADGKDVPVLSSELDDLELGRPTSAETGFEGNQQMHFTRSAALDEAAGANAFAPFTLPDKVADLPRRGDPKDFRAVGVYGRGPTALLGIPLRSSVTKALHDQLAENKSAAVTKQRVALQVGPLSVLLLVGRDGGLLLTGTVNEATLQDAAHDMVLGMVRTR